MKRWSINSLDLLQSKKKNIKLNLRILDWVKEADEQVMDDERGLREVSWWFRFEIEWQTRWILRIELRSRLGSSDSILLLVTDESGSWETRDCSSENWVLMIWQRPWSDEVMRPNSRKWISRESIASWNSLRLVSWLDERCNPEDDDFRDLVDGIDVEGGKERFDGDVGSLNMMMMMMIELKSSWIGYDGLAGDERVWDGMRWYGEWGSIYKIYSQSISRKSWLGTWIVLHTTGWLNCKGDYDPEEWKRKRKVFISVHFQESTTPCVTIPRSYT